MEKRPSGIDTADLYLVAILLQTQLDQSLEPGALQHVCLTVEQVAHLLGEPIDESEAPEC